KAVQDQDALAEVLLKLAEIARKQEYFDTMEGYLRQALEALIGLKDKPVRQLEVLAALEQQADERGASGEADNYRQQRMAIEEMLMRQEEAERFSALAQLAMQGKRYDDAQMLYERLLALYEKRGDRRGVREALRG